MSGSKEGISEWEDGDGIAHAKRKGWKKEDNFISYWSGSLLVLLSGEWNSFLVIFGY